MMTAVFVAEAIKIRKRPATWVLGGILVSALVLLGYVASYVALQQIGGDPRNAQDAEIFRRLLLPENVVPVALGIIAGLGGAIALILGAIAAGSEYGWNTLKTILTQRPGRLTVLGGKVGGLAVLLAVFVAACFAAAFASSLVVARLTDAAIHLPGAWEVVRGFGAAWLILGAWTAIGFALAVLFRGTALAVGLGLVYGLVIENLIAGFSNIVGWLETVNKALPGTNASALTGSFGSGLPGGEGISSVDATQGALVLATYVVGAVALAALALRRRDVA